MALECYTDAEYSIRTILAPPATASHTVLPLETLWAPGVTRRPLPTDMGGTLVRSRGLVLHVQAGLNSPWGWFNRPEVQASSHWWVAKSGAVEQYVPADRIAWGQAQGNSAWHSVETEGVPEEGLTVAQVAALARLYAWGHDRWGWTFGLADTPDGVGLGWHGMGGAAWGNHPGCPGEIRRHQRQAVLDAAFADPQEEPMPTAEEIAEAVARAVWEYPPPTTDVDRRIQKPTMAAVAGETYNKAGDIQSPKLTGLESKVDANTTTLQAIATAFAQVLGEDHPAAVPLTSPTVVSLATMRSAVSSLTPDEALQLGVDLITHAAALIRPQPEGVSQPL